MRISDWSSDVCSSDLQQGYLVLDALVARPGIHHEGVVDGDAEDLVDAHALDVAGERHVARQVARRAGGREGGRHGEHDHPAPAKQRDDRLLHPLSAAARSEEHTSEPQSLMRYTSAGLRLKKQTSTPRNITCH